MIVINGAHGEGGGQILRTSLTLATMLSQPVTLINIRANRRKPGLAAQHLTAVWAAAMICDAHLSGDALGSTRLTFIPQRPPIPGLYEFDVAAAREGGSAGAAGLVLQTLLLPLASAAGPSTVTVKGGTHVAWSPSFHYLQGVYLPMVARLGFGAEAELVEWGWYPAGQGALTVNTPGRSQPAPPGDVPGLARGELLAVHGVAVAANLPAHIAQRMRDRATNLLQEAGLPADISPHRARSVSPGAGIFLTAEYEQTLAGFTGMGAKGKPSERVAEEAVEALLAFHRSEAVFEQHLADQLLLPLVLIGYTGPMKVEALTNHTLTNLWVIEKFLGPVAAVKPEQQLLDLKPPPDLVAKR